MLETKLASVRGAHGQRTSRLFTKLIEAGVLAGVALATTASLAQQTPDAGRLLQEQPRPPAPLPSAPPAAAAPAPVPRAPSGGPTIQVTEVRFRGNTLIPASELAARVRGVVGRQVPLSELLDAATSLTGFYAQRGYAARVTLPPQTVVDGVVEFLVVEGKRGQVTVVALDDKLDASRIEGFYDARLPAGGPLDLDALSETTAIVNTLPGITATSSIARGAGEQEVDVTINAAPRPPVTFTAGADNSGSRSSGVVNVQAAATLANPFVGLDQLSVFTNVSEGTRYVRGAYEVAVGNRGLVLGVNAAALTYRLLGSAFAALEARGDARTFGATANYPVTRGEDSGLSIIGGAEVRLLEDRTVAGQTGDRRVEALVVGVQGYTLLPPALPKGNLSYELSVSAGRADQRNAVARAADLASRDTQGGFSKASWQLESLLALTSEWLVSAKGRGQWAGNNLDSSERIALGGPRGVRAYPNGEALGDEGALLSVAVQRSLGATLRASVFYDGGWIRQNKTVPAAGIATPNSYSLAGAGVRVDWQPARRTVVSLTVATPLGDNPGRGAGNVNVDGTRSNATRAWLAVTSQF